MIRAIEVISRGSLDIQGVIMSFLLELRAIG
jgi:hypothetical protein